MGVNNLLPVLSPVLRRVDIRSLSGQTAGIDGHVWLHRSVFTDLQASSLGKATVAHIRYFMNRAKFLQNLGLKPIIVFDGNELPAKSYTDNLRCSRRATSLARAIGLRDCGNSISAQEHFAKAADVSHDMVGKLVAALRTEGIDAFVAPYEADAQLTYLALTGLVDFVITEDSDLAVYGCPRVVFKLDTVAGIGVELSSPFFEAPSFSGLNESASIVACVLAGCDYGPQINGVGIKRAIKLVRTFSQLDDTLDFNQLALFLKNEGYKIGDTASFSNHMRIATLVFRFQTVFDPIADRLTSLRAPRRTDIVESELLLIGEMYSDELARAIYHGLAHPVPNKFSHRTDVHGSEVHLPPLSVSSPGD